MFRIGTFVSKDEYFKLPFYNCLLSCYLIPSKYIQDWSSKFTKSLFIFGFDVYQRLHKIKIVTLSWNYITS